MFHCVQILLMVLGLMLFITSLMDVGCGIISVTKGVISPMCHFFGKIRSSGLVFMTAHRRFTGYLVPKILRGGTMNKFCSDAEWIPVKL